MPARACHGNGLIVCCFLPGGVHPTLGDGVCPLLEIGTVPGRFWVCGARRRAGSWAAAHASEEYQTIVRPVWDTVITENGTMADCGDWRVDGQCCYGDNPPVYDTAVELRPVGQVVG